MSNAIEFARVGADIAYKPTSEINLIMAGSQGPGVAALLDEATIKAKADPEFRALSRDGERKGVRLEAVFWEALEDVASELGVPRNALAFSIMSIAGQAGANATSVLRSFLMAYMLDRKERPKAPDLQGE